LDVALKGASARLKNHREPVLAACAIRGKAPQHASLALRSDRAVVLCAVRQDGTALHFASWSLPADLQFGKFIGRAFPWTIHGHEPTHPRISA
jgi:hypothetical protein